MRIRNKKTGEIVEVDETQLAEYGLEVPKAKSGIYIKPKNRGKFNATKKRTGKTTEELTHSSNPVTRKRAIFAQNAAKWGKANWGTQIPLTGIADGTGVMETANMYNHSIFQPQPEYMTPIMPDNTPDKTLAPKVEEQKENPWKDWGKQALNQLSSPPESMPTPPNPIFGNVYMQRAMKAKDKSTQKLMEAAEHTKKGFQSWFGMGKYGKILSKAQFGAGQIKAIQEWEAAAQASKNAFANMGIAGLNVSKGSLDMLGNMKINNFMRGKESQFRRQSMINDAENQPPIEMYGYNWEGRNNPLIMEEGGMSDRKVPRFMANVEVENKEVVQLPNGYTDAVYGETHANGGIPMNLEPGTRIFSDKLKEPTENRPYSKLATKYKTKKDFEMLKSKYAGKINKDTADLNIMLKNQELENLFTLQEVNKLSGAHGSKPKREALKDYQMKYGGLKQYGGQSGSSEVPPYAESEAFTAGKGADRLEAKYQALKKIGYTGAKNIGEMQKYIAKIAPSSVHEYALRGWHQPTNKGQKLYPGKPLSKYTPEEILNAFQDEKWWYRLPEFRDKIFTSQEEYDKWLKDARKTDIINGKQYYVTGDSPEIFETPILQLPTPPPAAPEKKAEDPVAPIEKTPFPSQSKGFPKLKPSGNFYIPDTYQRDPIWTKTLDPEYIDPRYLDIQPELNDINREILGFTSNLGSRNSTDVANILQMRTNALNSRNKLYSQKYNYDRQQDAQAQQFNAQAKMNTNNVNLNEFTRFNNAINQREAAITAQRKFDQNAAMQNAMEQERFANQDELLQKLYNPSSQDDSQAFAFNSLPKPEQETKKKAKKKAKYGKKVKK